MADPDREEQELLDPVEKKVPFYLRIELYLPLILIGGISLAVLLYARGMFGAGWQLGMDTEGFVGRAFVDPSPEAVVLYTSPTTRAFLTKVGGSHDALLKHWREYFKEHKRPFREVDDPAALAKLGKEVIVVPSGLALDEAERKALTEHHRKGGSILATSAFGARDGAGTWTGWGLMQELFGAQVTDEVESAAEKNFLVTADVPVTVGMPSGSRFWVGKTPENLLRFEGGQVAARFMDWARTADGKGASVVFGEKAGGRWVLFGFSENAWDAAPTPMRTLADGAIDWLQRRPKAVLASWPDGYRAAHIVSMNVDGSVENARSFASTLELLKIRGTFFVVADAAAKSPGPLKSLMPNHEIAYHGDGYKGFKGQAKAEQERRVKEMQEKLVSSLRPDARITGFRAPGESYDARTEEVLQAAGFRYEAVDPNRTDARLPLFARANKAPAAVDLVVLPRTQRDDVVYLLRADVALNEIIEVMKGELGMVVEEGGLGMLSVHSRNFAKDGLISQAAPAYLLSLAELRSRVWLTTGGELADWWRKRENLGVTLSILGKRYELEVSNLGEENVEGATAIVYHPRAATVVVTPTKAWMPDATVRRVDDFSSQILFGTIRKGNYAYKLVFE